MNAFAPDLFDGRTIVVTGAARGIGAAVARELLALGATVVAHAGRKPPADDDDLVTGLPDAHRDRLTILEADLADAGEAERLAEAIFSRVGRIDGLVNNAGTMIGRIPAEETDLAAYEKVVDLNARSVVLLTRALLPGMGEGASIVNTTSISARTGGSAGSSLYSSAKAFVATYTRSLAKELGPRGIRVNSVAPGTIDTAFHQRYSSPEKLAATAKAIPLGRLGTPDDCVGAYLFLLSGDLSGYITGQSIDVNGGQLLA
ncbi:3-oxoacyl-[acyl-carrier-protein] reductase FabG [Hartmannibacter diazotrophicus]|uniref:3-oxoacyl-[acyl-carrier-protein] reductase FabG n=1 Tax=Hartmannibacter diazotrophicus TaxID=1482074 RepID=A0A2C9D1S0_9HYPH|nr:SDR family oxidoreductase [Hartmannibacter diazotrophicus]SON53751.1 3-oxoacyl-[acyl-carrier-protein] reductase FabG [Hartmannibacter diazotrophicus]